jgi:cellulose synthase/poly-beta-1,6-N-acetylglucosamine synthase-like glycosyltransferase
VANLDYPSDLLQIQILDDSTDDTPDIAKIEVAKYFAKGLNIELIHRSHRDGFKAGALAEGLKSAHGEFIAVFDADFVPHANFLKRLIIERRGFDAPDVGFLQTRWSFLNRDMSDLTEVQGHLMDSHFFIDQPARYHADFPLTFNGSGGVWRKACIEDAGGWQFDTLTEDLDLSLRAKMKGWRGIYYIEEESPNDLPADMLAFKQQQKRWARGNAQCLRKLLFTLFASKLTIFQKLSSMFHMSGYFVSMIFMAFIIIYPWVALDKDWVSKIPIWVHFLGLFCLSYFVTLFIANKKRGGDVMGFFRRFYFTLIIIMGISVNNTVSVLLGLLRKQVGVFERTPKEEYIPITTDFGDNTLLSNEKLSSPNASQYRLKLNWTMWVELGVACYSFTMAVIIFRNSLWYYSLLMIAYGIVFSVFSLIQLRDVIRSRSQFENPSCENIDTFHEKEATSPVE